ncbi:MAG: hypothetical protein O3C70_03615 [Actinomycetota bacterium]|nr:hypothetical protein [Actinomycetota bacterium]
MHGDDGLDELTTTTTSSIWEVRDGDVREWTLDPSTLGIAPAEPADLRGGDVAHNRTLADAIISGEPGPRADLVALNAAAALVVADVAEDLAAGLELARTVLAAGAARDVLDRWVRVSQQARADEAEEA